MGATREIESEENSEHGRLFFISSCRVVNTPVVPLFLQEIESEENSGRRG